MNATKGDFTGYSNDCIRDAIQDALKKAGTYQRVAIIETRGSKTKGKTHQYEATVTTLEK